MIIGRVIGWIFIVAAIAILVRDFFAWIDTGALAFAVTGELWFTLHSGSLNLLQAITQRYIFPALWDPIFVTVLLWPAFLVIGVPGLILSYAFRRRRRLSPKPA
jgi:membrane protease YdiL (CAAX protease family)